MCFRRVSLTGALVIVGFAASVLGVLLLISAAAGVHWAWGIACALIPVLSWLAFCACHWKRAWPPLAISVSGMVVAMVLGLVIRA